jgi:inositol phosphorylceramide mannosyltransferase catalytic subunit
MRWVGVFWVLGSIFLGGQMNAEVCYPDFQESMIRRIHPLISEEKRMQQYMSANKRFVELFKDIYEKNIALSKSLPKEQRIPKIIHQIWLGKDRIPKQYCEWMKSWACLKGWEYKLWTDEDVELLTLHNRDLYDRSRNYGEKADILRLELLQQFGGLYVDLDYECLRPEIFEEFHCSYDLYMGFEPMDHGFTKKNNLFKLCNALMASIPNHPLIKHLIVNMKANYLAYTPFCGPVEKTGPSYLTRIVVGYEQSSVDKYRNIYLPCTFFYPLTESELRRKDGCCLPAETAGLHYWGGSWRAKAQSYEESYE